MGNLKSSKRRLLRGLVRKKKFRPSPSMIPKVSFRSSSAQRQLHPFSLASPRVKRFAAIGVAALLAFMPSKSRAFESREPPVNIASFADTQNVRLLYKHQWGAQKHALGFDAFRVGYKPKVFGLTNSGPVFVYENIFNRTTPDSIRVGVAQGFSLSPNSTLKLGLLSPDLAADKKFKDTRFGVIFTKGAFGLDYHYRGAAGGVPSSGGGVSFDVSKHLTLGLGLGAKGYTSPNDSVRFGLKLKNVEDALGLKKGALWSPAVDFGITKQNEKPNEIDVGLIFSPSKRIKFGLDAYDLGAKVGNKSGAKIGGIIVINF